jgi:hypothetical protein
VTEVNPADIHAKLSQKSTAGSAKHAHEMGTRRSVTAPTAGVNNYNTKSVVKLRGIRLLVGARGAAVAVTIIKSLYKREIQY